MFTETSVKRIFITGREVQRQAVRKTLGWITGRIRPALWPPTLSVSCDYSLLVETSEFYCDWFSLILSFVIFRTLCGDWLWYIHFVLMFLPQKVYCNVLCYLRTERAGWLFIGFILPFCAANIKYWAANIRCWAANLRWWVFHVLQSILNVVQPISKDE